MHTIVIISVQLCVQYPTQHFTPLQCGSEQLVCDVSGPFYETWKFIPSAGDSASSQRRTVHVHCTRVGWLYLHVQCCNTSIEQCISDRTMHQWLFFSHPVIPPGKCCWRSQWEPYMDWGALVCWHMYLHKQTILVKPDIITSALYTYMYMYTYTQDDHSHEIIRLRPHVLQSTQWASHSPSRSLL